MLLNDRSLTNHKDGLSNSFHLTNQDFYVRLEYKKTKKTIASLQAVPSPSCTHFDFPSFLRPAMQASLRLTCDQTCFFLFFGKKGKIIRLIHLFNQPLTAP